jgi:N-methylhydantoinase B
VVAGQGQRPPLGAKQDGVILNRGDRIVIRSPGGGGFGDPMTRAISQVADDVRLGFVDAAAARAVYGVAMNGDGTVDDALTARLRTQAAHV